jgi:hypothetical protein
LPGGFYLSVVVLQELVAGANDSATIKGLERSWHEYRKSKKLLVPTQDDWWHVGRAINALQHGNRSRTTGKIPKLPFLKDID